MQTMTKAPAMKDTLAIDFPQAGEVVTAPSYTLRIKAPEASGVDVSLDNGAWQPCRYAVGFWWYDWSEYRSGAHLVRVQAKDASGDAMALESRRIMVKLDGDEPVPAEPQVSEAASSGPASHRKRRRG